MEGHSQSVLLRVLGRFRSLSSAIGPAEFSEVAHRAPALIDLGGIRELLSSLGTYAGGLYVGGHICWGTCMLEDICWGARMHICRGHICWGAHMLGVRILGGMYSVCMGRCDVKRHKYLTVSRCYTLR